MDLQIALDMYRSVLHIYKSLRKAHADSEYTFTNRSTHLEIISYLITHSLMKIQLHNFPLTFANSTATIMAPL